MSFCFCSFIFRCPTDQTLHHTSLLPALKFVLIAMFRSVALGILIRNSTVANLATRAGLLSEDDSIDVGGKLASYDSGRLSRM